MRWNLAATAAGAAEGARETKPSGGRAVPAAFQEVTWRAGRGLRGLLRARGGAVVQVTNQRGAGLGASLTLRTAGGFSRRL